MSNVYIDRCTAYSDFGIVEERSNVSLAECSTGQNPRRGLAGTPRVPEFCILHHDILTIYMYQ